LAPRQPILGAYDIAAANLTRKPIGPARLVPVADVPAATRALTSPAASAAASAAVDT
jgi:hypothetical protein